MHSDLPKISWPALFLFFISFTGFFLNFFFVHRSIYGENVGIFLAFLCLYFIFTPLHESVHYSIFLGPHSKWSNTVTGFLSGLMLLAPFPVFKILHLKHHAYVNHPDKDPDHWVKGDNPLIVFFKFATLFFFYYYLFFKDTKKLKSSLVTVLIYNFVFSLVMLTIVHFTSVEFLLKLWIYPLIGAIIFLGLTFDFIPHYPHDDQTRFNNSRTIPSRLLSILMVNQNYHIIHHLYPRVPFYMYKSVFENMSPEDKAKHYRV
jgi:beta-carotene hydroxylase